MFDTTPLTRYRPGEWGSVVARMRALSSVLFSHHNWPQPMKKRCSGVKPSACPSGLAARLSISAIQPRRRPPLSAVFSPSVSLPFSFTSPTAVKPEYSSAMQAARSSNALPSAGVHQSRRLPCGVELPALVVEPVRQLVADDRARRRRS